MTTAPLDLDQIRALIDRAAESQDARESCAQALALLLLESRQRTDHTLATALVLGAAKRAGVLS